MDMKPAVLCPYLNFNGDCRQAMEFYQSCLGGKLDMQTFGDAGMAQDPAMKDKIVHAMLESGDIVFMASETMPDMPFTKGNNVHMSLVGTDDAKLRGFFEKLSAGGSVSMKLEKQFWGDVFGTLTDKFGVHWMVNIAEKKA